MAQNSRTKETIGGMPRLQDLSACQSVAGRSPRKSYQPEGVTNRLRVIEAIPERAITGEYRTRVSAAVTVSATARRRSSLRLPSSKKVSASHTETAPSG